ncbi:hypothetical protein [Streptomyces sp. NPDC005407]|uniref:hypothetical protein n=1 Tax=Streptomyces sp. NPDC005407 TaxID=3155340 RepID=UPI0033BEBCC3
MEVSTSRGGQDRPVEITALAVEQGAVSLAGRRGATHTAICSPEVHEELLEFSFRAWEVITPAQGAAPYVYATADLHLRFPSMTGVPVLLTIITPEDVSPRSTQGNYALAYPSRLLNGQRQTNIYFPSADAVRLAYRCGESGQFSGNPWVSIGRSAFNSVFVFFVGVLAASVDRGDRFGALIVTFLAVAGALWEIVQETSRFTIYDKTRRYIHGLVLGAQLSTLAVLSASVISISLTDSGRLLHFSSYLALAVAGVLGVTSCIGFFLHYQGFWQGFQCDHAGCARVFRIRRDRPECRYTGRVFCDEHVRTVCRGCAHESDLLGGTVSLSQ